MLRATRIGLTIVLGLVVASLANAAEFGGVITGVDLGKRQIQFEGRGDLDGERLTFQVNLGTQVLLDGRRGKLSDLAVGQRVRIESRPRGGRPVARTIHVTAPKPSAPAKAPPETGSAVVRASGDLVTGILRRVAWTDREIVVIGPGDRGAETETTIAVPENAVVRRGENAIEFEGLREEESVTVSVTRQDGRLVAQQIQAGPGIATTSGRTPAFLPIPSPTPQPEERKGFPRLRKLLKLGEKVLDEIERRQGGEQ